jgi:hypothetical protein
VERAPTGNGKQSAARVHFQLSLTEALAPQIGHWNEQYLRDELITGVHSGSLPLSRITIGSLDDMGYTVDFNQADPYTIADLRQCGSFCPARGVRRLQTNERRAEVILEMNTNMMYTYTEIKA